MPNKKLIEKMRASFGGKELRAVSVEMRASNDGTSARVSGAGIVYDQWTELFPGFRERILRGAVKKDGVVKSFFNHDPSMVLSTEDSDPKLVLKDSDYALEFDSPIPPTTYGKDLEINLARGNVRGASFAFSVLPGGDSWSEDENGNILREISSINLAEVGPVTNPAYLQSSASLRSAMSDIEEFRAQAEKSKKESEARDLASNDLDLRKRKLNLIERM